MNNKPLKYVPLVVIVSLIIIYVSRSMSNTILLFPFWLNAVLFLITFPISYYFANKWAIFLSAKEEDKRMMSGLNALIAILLAFVMICLVRLPLNVFIKQQSKKNELITQTCPITYYSLGLKGQQKNHITFTFQDKSIRMKVTPTMLAKIKALSSPDKNIQLRLRKSILGTYVVEDYDVK